MSEPILYVVGDVHGDLNQFLEPYIAFVNDKQHENNKELIYLGDYIDRGEYDAYIYILMKAMMNGPYGDRITFLRGNHEEKKTNPDLYTRFRKHEAYTYKKEGKIKTVDRTFNGHFRQNESFVWKLYHDEQLPLYRIVRRNNEWLLFSHSPIMAVDDKFTITDDGKLLFDGSEVDVKNGANGMNTGDFTSKYPRYRDEKGYNVSFDFEHYQNLINQTNGNIRNIFGHIHANEKLYNRLLESSNFGNELFAGGDNKLKSFTCLDTDASYGFRLKHEIWNKKKVLNKSEREHLYSSVNYAIIYGDNVNCFKRMGDKDYLKAEAGFNNVISLEQLKGKLKEKLGDSLDGLDSNTIEAAFNDVVECFKSYLSHSDYETYDDMVYNIYAQKALLKYGEKEFQRLIKELKEDPSLETSGDIHVSRNKMDLAVMLFNNVPGDVIRASGVNISDDIILDQTPFEIFVNIILARNTQIWKNEENQRIIMTNEEINQKFPFSGGGVYGFSFWLLLLMLMCFVVIVVVIVRYYVNVNDGGGDVIDGVQK